MKKFRPGLSFGDFVQKGGKVWKNRIEGERDYRRGWVVWLGTVLALGLLLVRAFDLQVLQGGKLRVLADENRIKTIRLSAPRGVIRDRNGQIIALNNESGIRNYVLGEATAHVIGYLGEVKEDEVGLVKESGGKYEVGSRIGRAGIEMQYEDVLRGVDGGRLVEVDNNGEEKRQLGQKEPTVGKDIKLFLDVGLQNVAYSAVKDKKAGIIVSDPRSGEVLVLVSSPSFDPTRVQDFLNDKNLPMFNRAIGGVYPPGSTFKMITIAAALESGRVGPDFTFLDTGVITVGRFRYTNWLFTKRGGVEGRVGFARALTRSTDTFFYKVGELAGPENIADWAKKMGLGGVTGIDLPGEVPGMVPNPSASSGQAWYLGNTYHLAIGQGDLLTTPLQINLMTNVIASGGKKCVPHLLQIPNPKSQETNNNQCPIIQISKETLDIIMKGMVGACSTGGTSFVMFDWNADAKLPKIACKTGTAEYVAENGKIKTHGWLTAFAPADNPVISATVVIEGGGEGSNVAAPVVRKIFAKYFNVEDKYPYGAIRGEGE